MAHERDALILAARDRLRAAFGEAAFDQFDNYAKGYKPKTLVVENVEKSKSK